MQGWTPQTCKGEVWLFEERKAKGLMRSLHNVSANISNHIDGELPTRPRPLLIRTCLTNQLPLSSVDSYTAAIKIRVRGDATQPSRQHALSR